MHSDSYLERPDSTRIAYRHLPGHSPGIFFCPGFNSDMQGTKAQALDAWCRDQGRQFTRFDYFAHGQSSGEVGQGFVKGFLQENWGTFLASRGAPFLFGMQDDALQRRTTGNHHRKLQKKPLEAKAERWCIILYGSGEEWG